MPTIKKRHRCDICGSIRVESEMEFTEVVQIYRKNGIQRMKSKGFAWICNGAIHVCTEKQKNVA